MRLISPGTCRSLVSSFFLSFICRLHEIIGVVLLQSGGSFEDEIPPDIFLLCVDSARHAAFVRVLTQQGFCLSLHRPCGPHACACMSASNAKDVCVKCNTGPCQMQQIGGEGGRERAGLQPSLGWRQRGGGTQFPRRRCWWATRTGCSPSCGSPWHVGRMRTQPAGPS